MLKDKEKNLPVENAENLPVENAENLPVENVENLPVENVENLPVPKEGEEIVEQTLNELERESNAERYGVEAFAKGDVFTVSEKRGELLILKEGQVFIGFYYGLKGRELEQGESIEFQDETLNCVILPANQVLQKKLDFIWGKVGVKQDVIGVAIRRHGNATSKKSGREYSNYSVSFFEVKPRFKKAVLTNVEELDKFYSEE